MTLIDPAPQGVWPLTVTGWGTLIVAVSTLGFLFYDKIAGKSRSIQRMETQLEALATEIKELKETRIVLSNVVMTLNESILKLTFEIKGVDGMEGAKGDIREIRTELAQIQARNRKKDIAMARLEDSIKPYAGEDRREQARRHEHDRRTEDNT